jgi:DNA-binding NtrC family response regulator
MIAASDEMQRIFFKVKQVAKYFSVLLISGPPGTGKDMLAGAVHKVSDRPQGPLIRFHCAAVTAEAAEAQLFGELGREAGATYRPGMLEKAAGGVLLLDQIESLPSHVQNKLLNFLDTNEFTAVGSTEIKTLDAKLVAMTSKDLHLESEEGRFLEELYYRLSRIEFRLPPLAERGADVLLLARYFVTRVRTDRPKPVSGFTDTVITLFNRYPWEGNVRELKNTIESAAMIASVETIDLEDLPRGLTEFYRQNQQLLGKEIISALAQEPRDRRRGK